MTFDQYTTLRLGAGALATLGLFSVLYKENRFYRLFEHIFLGLASGYLLVLVYSETLVPLWWDKIMGTPASGTSPASNGNWAYILLLPLGIMGYFVFSKKHNWMSRIPIGIILGLWSGQQIQIFWNTYGPQLAASMQPILPNTYDRFTVPAGASVSPELAEQLATRVYPSQAIGNLMFIITLLSVLSYFLFSFEVKNKIVRNTSLLGRYLLMIGFGAIFGNTVMMRFTLLIDRMYFVFIEFLQQGVFHR
ncbi:hypothetical protein EON77_02610 [bacterium]|nr:MAG: hypothetical protein EON77_02610 [bacterium]